MSDLLMGLPEEVRAEVARRTAARGIDVAAWVAEAVRQKLSAEAQLEYLQARAARGSREAYERALAQVPDAPPMPGDEW